MTKPFDYINSITYDKNNMMRDSENDTLAEKAYEPWLTNKALSHYPDTILHANLMNCNYHLDNRPQYEFLINSVRRKKRFEKWTKKAEDQNLKLVCELYGCNATVGKQYLSLLSNEQLNIIKKEKETGGLKK